MSQNVSGSTEAKLPGETISGVTLSINGKDITVPAGSTIMEAVKKMGDTEVPHFCWHPGLSIAGVCRFCMVKVEGMPKLQIACNTQVRDGMKVDTVADDVKDTHKWALEFHLINHPLDCPICDQAGECELQNYYMKVGKYTSQMQEDKVLKPKALDVGDTLVLDTERCILCSRCVRFEDEVTKTSTLGIFNRGDKAVIGTYKDRRVTHNYSYNLADICPVGAFTSKDFRFKCRVWFLKESDSICPGCSTGCNVKVSQNSNSREYYRLKPRENAEVNGHWMCDYGRTMFEHLNVKERLIAPSVPDVSKASITGKDLSWAQAHEKFAGLLGTLVAGAAGAGSQTHAHFENVALVLTPQYTNEEFELILSSLKKRLGAFPKVYIWRDASEKVDAFDGILFRGDKNPNTRGLNEVLARLGVSAQVCHGLADLVSSKPLLSMVFGPEIEKAYPSFERDLGILAQLALNHPVVYFGNTLNASACELSLRIPTLCFTEKTGTFTNHAGLKQELKANSKVIPSLKSLEEFLG